MSDLLRRSRLARMLRVSAPSESEAWQALGAGPQRKLIEEDRMQEGGQKEKRPGWLIQPGR
jgi:hypothetical protein